MRHARCLLVVALACACGRDEPSPPPAPPPVAVAESEPDVVAFDHILIAFEGAMKSRAFRSRAEAEALARRVYEALRDGANWFHTKDEFTDDRASTTNMPLGPYVIVNDGVRADVGEIPRNVYSKDLGDKLFSMRVGEMALVEYHQERCPFGYHILLRTG